MGHRFETVDQILESHFAYYEIFLEATGETQKLSQFGHLTTKTVTLKVTNYVVLNDD